MTVNRVDFGDALSFYDRWASPTVIISDGAYGIGGFPGDPKQTKALPSWYEPHVAAWSETATPGTWLWFWNTEAGWAVMHSLLENYGWKYVELVVWNKGIQHVAGNVNGRTIRQFPVVTEVSGLYMKEALFKGGPGQESLSLQDWLREEWYRAGLPFSAANQVCGVKNAATRKWLTADHHWYMPPYEAYRKLADYANMHGNQDSAPFFHTRTGLFNEKEWNNLRGVWNHTHGLTNVWDVPSLRSVERVKSLKGKPLHANQKPLLLMERQIAATTNLGDVVWEPFGGLCSGSVAAKKLGRDSYAAEMNPESLLLASQRVATLP